MSRILPRPGTYTARRRGAIVVREEESGALMVYIPYSLCDSEIKFGGEYSVCIGTKAGQLQLKAIATLRKIWPDWDGENPFELEAIPIPEGSEPEFSLADCFHDDSYTPEGANEPVIQFKARWLNELGGVQAKKSMTEDERGDVMNKWGGKFKAVKKSGGKAPAREEEEEEDDELPMGRKGSAPSRPDAKTPARSAGGTARTSTGEEVLAAIKKANKKSSEDEIAKIYWDAADEIGGKSANGELTPTQWGKVLDSLDL